MIISTNSAGMDRGDVTIEDRVEWYAESTAITPGTLTILAEGDIFARDHIRSAGTGGINLVAGWDGMTGLPTVSPYQEDMTDFSVSMTAILATMNDGNANDAAGNNDGSLYMNGATTIMGGRQNNDNQVAIGSRFGDTNIAAHDIVMVETDQWLPQIHHDRIALRV